MMLLLLMLVLSSCLSCIASGLVDGLTSTTCLLCHSSHHHVSSTISASVTIPTSVDKLGVETLATTILASTNSYQSFTKKALSTTKPSQGSMNTLLLVGSARISNNTDGRTKTRTAPKPINTQKCNGHVEFCDRRYLNVTEVCSHNSAFAVSRNAASNQDVDLIRQLNDGIRMIQGETHLLNGSMYSCHTSCNLLNAGTLLQELTTIREWIQAHPYDIVTILLVNSDYVEVDEYVEPILNSGLKQYLYEPPKKRMNRTDWPKFSEMLLLGKRAVLFLDYNANETTYPYILDQFSQMWETSFSPTDETFPCSKERPPALTRESAKTLPYLANHNLNIAIELGSVGNILIPKLDDLNQTNSVAGLKEKGTIASLGLMANNCIAMWDYAPAFLMVDYYNFGDYPGSVFEVAAQLNNVTYSRKCCGDNLQINSAVSLWACLKLRTLIYVFITVVTFISNTSI